MGIHDLFSKRQKRQRGEVPDVYVYDQIPKTLRVQLIQIIKEGIGGYGESSLLYERLNKALCREYGVFSLTESNRLGDWEIGIR
jgi:hypothetical protein